MKLEKREITLNEKDSLKDIYYLETLLLSEYGDKQDGFRKETENAFENLEKEIRAEKELVDKLLKRA